MTIKKQSLSKSRMVCLGGILTALAIVFQSCPVWLPGFGLALSPLSSFPIALASCLSPMMGILSYLSSIAILSAFSVEEMIIFAATTGLLGVISGLAAKKSIWLGGLFSGCGLFLGTTILFSLVGIDIYGPLTQYFMDHFYLSFLFSYGYSIAFLACFKLIRKLFKAE